MINSATLYNVDGMMYDLPIIDGKVSTKAVKKGLGGPFCVLEVGDNAVAVLTGALCPQVNKMASYLMDNVVYGPAVVGHRSLF